jgi:2,3-bisphosphoglycerate-dependent phosphoglycerate mutase
MKIILLRHGQSQWNLENRFTGWKDVQLTEDGKVEARQSASSLIENNIFINSIHTSILERAKETAKIVSTIIGFNESEIVMDWRLNERHYGALEGLNKSETAAKYGEEQVLIWRRSYDVPPPLMNKNDERHPRNYLPFNSISTENLPEGESLKDVIERLSPFWAKFLKSLKDPSGNHLIVAHSNSLRAIIKILENLSEEEILDINIPTGVPLVYDLKNNFVINKKKYLIDNQLLLEKLKIVKNQGKAI